MEGAMPQIFYLGLSLELLLIFSNLISTFHYMKTRYYQNPSSYQLT